MYQDKSISGADPGFDQGGAPDRDRPKTAILGPQFCSWGLIFGGQGGPGPPGPPPGSAPASPFLTNLFLFQEKLY